MGRGGFTPLLILPLAKSLIYDLRGVLEFVERSLGFISYGEEVFDFVSETVVETGAEVSGGPSSLARVLLEFGCVRGYRAFGLFCLFELFSSYVLDVQGAKPAIELSDEVLPLPIKWDSSFVG
jgi:hypothetical protein